MGEVTGRVFERGLAEIRSLAAHPEPRPAAPGDVTARDGEQLAADALTPMLRADVELVDLPVGRPPPDRGDLRVGFLGDIPLDWDPQAIADWLLSKYARGQDDALVLAARYVGGAP